MLHHLITSEHAEHRAPTRLRWSMCSMLVLITLCLGVAAWQSWHDEQERASDAELINVTGHQRALSLQTGLRSGDEAARIAMEPLETLEVVNISRNTRPPSMPSTEATAARLGGDEFVALLDGLAHPDDATMVAQRLLAALASAYDIHGHEVNSTASIGFVTSADAWTEPQSLLHDADTAMYVAKRSGRSRVVHFVPSMTVSDGTATSA